MAPEEIVGIRVAGEMTLAELGSQLNVSGQTVSNWELGFNRPSRKNMIKLSQMYNRIYGGANETDQ